MTALTNEQIEASLKDSLDNCKSSEEALLKANEDLIVVQSRMNIQDAKLTSEVANEKTDDDKKKYSNADQRKHEIERRKRDDEEWMKLNESFKDASHSVAMAQIEFNHHQRRFQAAVAMAGMRRGS